MQRRWNGISWAPVLYLVAFLVVVALAAVWVVEPMVRAAVNATPEEKRRLTAYAALCLTLLLAVLLFGLLMTLRWNWRATKKAEPRVKTEYPDAWAESAKRIKTPKAEELEDQDNPPEPPSS